MQHPHKPGCHIRAECAVLAYEYLYACLCIVLRGARGDDTQLHVQYCMERTLGDE